ncbi:MAG: ABC transporter ATP-binding protein/permease [Acholeplasmataceae bacterium]|nr:ABC transporter ATP-binding protein/permease [Acholeplasmataceae bacterium]
MLFGRYFFKYYIKYGLYFLAGILILVFVDWVQLDIPRLVGGIIDKLGEETPDAGSIRTDIWTIAIFAAGITVGRFIWRYTIFGASRRIEADIRNDMFVHASKLPQEYYSHEKVGGLMAHFINDLEALRMAYGPGLLMLVDGVALGTLAVIRMAGLNGTMTLLAGIPMLILMVVMVFIMSKVRLKFKMRQEAFEKVSDFSQEHFSGISVIKAYVREIKQGLLFQNRNEVLYDKNMGFVKYLVAINVAISVGLNLVIMLILIYGSMLVLRTDQTGLSAGQLTEYIAYFFTLIWPTMAIAQFLGIHSQAKASATRIRTLLDQKPIVEDSDQVRRARDLRGEIDVKNLTFQYPDGDEPVLIDVSFSIKKGEMVGILGRTGSGKSSLVDLFLRIYNLNRDQVFIDGYDIMDLPIKDVRGLMGYVPQDNFLFSDTIKNNIGFAFDTPHDDEVIASAKLADVYDNIMEFSHGFETMLGERGVTVSGGQKQRISIARALAKDPDILILDDSVSAVDTKTEEAIITNLHRIRKGKTTIFIAHRISTVKRMDKIILLERGRVEAVGTHKELLETSPLYASMVKLQELENIVEGDDGHEGL